MKGYRILESILKFIFSMIELAKLDNNELVYGTYEEVEAYAEEKDTWVIRYMDHVNPSTVYKNFKYVGNEMSNPYSVSVPFDYRESRAKGTFNDAGVNLDKW
tara:strand:+ start:196 stop:501 length:306 start_codon:yes stop_codon:yes gene_type:complete